MRELEVDISNETLSELADCVVHLPLSEDIETMSVNELRVYKQFLLNTLKSTQRLGRQIDKRVKRILSQENNHEEA